MQFARPIFTQERVTEGTESEKKKIPSNETDNFIKFSIYRKLNVCYTLLIYYVILYFLDNKQMMELL